MIEKSETPCVHVPQGPDPLDEDRFSAILEEEIHRDLNTIEAHHSQNIEEQLNKIKTNLGLLLNFGAITHFHKLKRRYDNILYIQGVIDATQTQLQDWDMHLKEHRVDKMGHILMGLIKSISHAEKMCQNVLAKKEKDKQYYEVKLTHFQSIGVELMKKGLFDFLIKNIEINLHKERMAWDLITHYNFLNLIKDDLDLLMGLKTKYSLPQEERINSLLQQYKVQKMEYDIRNGHFMLHHIADLFHKGHLKESQVQLIELEGLLKNLASEKDFFLQAGIPLLVEELVTLEKNSRRYCLFPSTANSEVPVCVGNNMEHRPH